MLLSNRVAIITGGARGIGKGIALKFASEGCVVAIADILEKEGSHTAAEISKLGGECIFIPCDVTKSAHITNTVDRVIAGYQKVDILVNNAGAMPVSMSVADLPEELWDKDVDLNLKSHFLFCKAVIPNMKQNHYGKIINVSSMGLLHSPRPSTAYHAAKAGLIGMSFDIASEVAPFNICVNVIMPGGTRTEAFDPAPPPVINSSDFFKNVGHQVPLGRMGTPEDNARVALFLASELADYLTGQIICVAGGQPFVSCHINAL